MILSKIAVDRHTWSQNDQYSPVNALFLLTKEMSDMTSAVARRGYGIRMAHSVADTNSFLTLEGDLLAILDTGVDPTILNRTFELLVTQTPPIPTLLLVQKGAAMEKMACTQVLGALTEVVMVDDTFSAEYIAQRVDALLIRAYSRERSLFAGRYQLPEQRQGKIISVYSPKGGAGATTIATNLAVAITQENRKRVALIDADLSLGIVGLLLGIGDQANVRACSIYDVVGMIEIPEIAPWDEAAHNVLDNITPDLLENLFYTHSSELRVLLAPPRPDLAEKVPLQVVQKIIEVCSSMFDYVVVHTPTSYSETALTVFDLSTTILLVIVPEIGALRNSSQFVDYASKLGWYDKLVFVLNRANSDRFSKISIGDVEKVLKAPVLPIVSSGIAVTAANRGVPFVTSFREEKIAKDVLKLADYIVNQDEKMPHRSTPKRDGIRNILRFANGRRN